MSKARSATMTRWIGLAIGVLFIVALARLAQLERGGPAHSNAMLPGGLPATLYLPGAGNPFRTLFPPPPADRPPAVVLVHGFLADRQMMSPLARRLAQNGYAVLAIDVQGHGENRNPLRGGEFVPGGLRADVQEAADFLRRHPLVDGSRLAVMGHSMGAGAALDFATHDPNLEAAVMISGGWGLGLERPKNALFIFAEHDPAEEIQQTSIALAGRLAGSEPIDLGQMYGSFENGTAVAAVRIAGLDHVQIVYSADTAATIISWLDRTFGMKRTYDIDLAEPRVIAAGFAFGLFALLLVPLGRLCGSIATRWAVRPGGVRGLMGVLVVVGALLAAMPLATISPPAAFVSLVVGDVQLSWFAIAGVFLVFGLAVSAGVDAQLSRTSLGRTLVAALLAFAVIYICQGATSVTFHRMSLSPERLLLTVIATVLVLPFWLAFELLVRRGAVPLSTALGLLGRALILVLIGAGASVQMLPGVMMLVLPSLAVLMVTMEIFAASAYSTSHNLVLIALVDSLWLAWSLAATNPITFRF